MSKLQQNPQSSPRNIQSYVFGVILVLLLLAVFRLLAPFVTALLWSTLLYIMLTPLHRRVIRNINFDTLKGKILRNFWAGVFTLGTIILIVFPLTMAVRLFFRQILELGHMIMNFLNERPEYLSEMYEKIAGLIRDVSADQIKITANDIDNQIRTLFSNEMQRVVQLSGNIIQSVGGFTLRFAATIFVMTFSMFFFYVDGPYLSRLVLKAIPIKAEYISTLTRKFLDITRNLILGYLMVAFLQSTVAFLIFTIFKIKGSLVFAVLTFILVFIPIVGATLIYIPIGAFIILGGNIATGIVFLLVSIVFISGIDNVLRPIFLKDRIQLHPLIIFFAILGGLVVFGFNGFILGPILVILFLTVLDLFLTEHKIGSQEPETRS